MLFDVNYNKKATVNRSGSQQDIGRLKIEQNLSDSFIPSSFG